MSTNTHYDAVLARLKELMSQALPNSSGDSDLEIPFLEMGANSLMLMDVQKTIESEYGLTITIGQFFEELTTINALVHYIDEQLQERDMESGSKVAEPELPAQPPPRNNENVDGEYRGNHIPSGDIEAIFANQIRITSEAMNDLVARQLAFLSGIASTSGTSASQTKPDTVSSPASKPPSTKPKGATQPNKILSPLEIRARGLTGQQQEHLESLIKKYNARTGKSKAYTQRYRGVLADSRAGIGFRFSTKEMLYPIVADRANGSRIWDIDGNEYIDITMGQGVSLFGHHPEFIESALTKEGSESVQLGPRPHNTGELAELICEMTGFERVTFTNSGTEAVMAALRLARAATGRTKIVMFEGAYHGHADSVMGTTTERDGKFSTQPISPGTPQGAVEDLWVLPYDEVDSLDFIRQNGDTIAAVFVEPVQSRNPGIQPREFLHELRKLTSESGSMLVFDEMITGFRTQQGGAQAHFGVRADLATYGKVIGGGMPIGVVAGKANLMDPIDGGAWSYGDNSYPEVNRVVFGGTFCQHPLAMTTSLATLKYLKEKGPSLQQNLNAKTESLAGELNDWFEKEEVPIKIVWFGSLFRFEFSTNLELLFYHMNLRGIFVWEWRNCFLSTAHTDEDIKRIIQVVKESVLAMRDGGFIPPKNGSKNDSSKDAVYEMKDYPLNSAQRQLATLAQISPEGSRAYHVSAQLLLSGSVDKKALSKAIDQVVTRHEALRTVIIGVDHQKVLDPAEGIMQSTDLSSKKNLDESLQTWLRKFAGSPMDLEKGPLFTAHLIKLGPKEHRLVLKGHHIILDGLSMNLIVSEIADCYSSIVTDKPLSFSTPLQYREYLEWQKSNSFKTQESYWTDQLSGDIPVLELPSDKPEPATRSYRGGRISKKIDPKLFKDLQSLSRKSGVTHFMTLFAMYALWLHRLSGQDEIIIGMPVAGRSLKGSEKLVGYCTHLIPIRSKVDWKEPFNDYLKRMRGVLLKGYEHQDYPFSRLIEKMNSHQNGRKGTIVQTVFNLDRPGEIPAFSGLSVSWLSQPVAHTAFDLVFNLTEIGEELVMECDFNDDRFEGSTIDRFTDCFVTMAGAVVKNPELSVAAVPLMSNELRKRWLADWNQTDHPYSDTETISRMFEEQVKKNSNKMALSFDGGKLTYNELNTEANRLSHFLRKQGADTDQVVAICLKRSPQLIISILAVLKAGAAYLPLDPAYPAARKSYMLEDAKPVLILTESELVEHIKVPASVKQILMDDESSKEWSEESDKNPESCSGPNDLAYILYTSGSTGKPKGTMIHQRGILNYLSWAVDYYDTKKGSGSPLHSSIGFDATLTSLFTPLLSGRILHLLPNEGVEIEHIAASLKGKGKKKPDWSLVKLTPSHLELLNEMIPDKDKSGLTRSIVLGGEALLGKTIRQWRLSAPDTSIINEYGPTETVVGCAVYNEKRSDPGIGPVPIGRPIWNTRLYVLDKNGYPVPPGVEGELYIGGDGVARGYLNRPDLTKQRFIDISETGLINEDGLPQDRLYRTGDRVKMLNDGNLIFMGRYDNQLKLRGYRIEPAEIESAITDNKDIREAVVMLKENANHQYLVAYIVTESGVSGKNPTSKTSRNKDNQTGNETDVIAVSEDMRTRLRGALKDRLPEYMIPTHYVILDKVPLNQNGKVDYSSLPEIGTVSNRETGRQIASLQLPRNDAEQRVASIWCELLEIEKVGRDENFFDVGGHSLLVLPLRDRLNIEFRRELIPADIFRYTTVASMANFLAPQTGQQKGVVKGGIPSNGSGKSSGEDSNQDRGKRTAGGEKFYSDVTENRDPVANGRKTRSGSRRKKNKNESRS